MISAAKVIKEPIAYGVQRREASAQETNLAYGMESYKVVGIPNDSFF